MAYIKISFNSTFEGKYERSGNISHECWNSKKHGKIRDETYLIILSTLPKCEFGVNKVLV